MPSVLAFSESDGLSGFDCTYVKKIAFLIFAEKKIENGQFAQQVKGSEISRTFDSR